MSKVKNIKEEYTAEIEKYGLILNDANQAYELTKEYKQILNLIDNLKHSIEQLGFSLERLDEASYSYTKLGETLILCGYLDNENITYSFINPSLAVIDIINIDEKSRSSYMVLSNNQDEEICVNKSIISDEDLEAYKVIASNENECKKFLKKVMEE